MNDQNTPVDGLDHEQWHGLMPPLIDVQGLLTQSLEHAVDVLSTPGHPVLYAVTLTLDGPPRTLVSSNPEASRLTETQYRLHDSPYHQASRTHTPICRVGAAGTGAVLAVPLPLNARTRGVLSLYSGTPRTFTPGARRFADMISVNIARLLQPAVTTAEMTDSLDDLQGALLARSIIDRAVGAIMGHQGCSQDEALTLLMRTARQRNTSMLTIADIILTTTAHD